LEEKHEVDGFGKEESGSNGLHLIGVAAIITLQFQSSSDCSCRQRSA